MAIERAIAHDISSGYADDSFEWYNSQDGRLRVWQVREGFRSLTELNKIALLGFINNLSISECGGCGWVVAGLGQEHRLGRWLRDKTAKNKLEVMNIPYVGPAPPGWAAHGGGRDGDALHQQLRLKGLKHKHRRDNSFYEANPTEPNCHLFSSP